MVKTMSDPDWQEVEGTVGKTVYFTVYKADGVNVEDLAPYDETGIQLKVYENDGTTLKFEKDMAYASPPGTNGRLKAYIGPGDIAIGDERSYFFNIELVKAKTGEAKAGGSETIFDTNMDEANDFWNGFTLKFDVGTVNAGESQVISDYAKTDGEVTMAEAFTGIPALGDGFTIKPSITVPTIRGTLLITQGPPA